MTDARATPWLSLLLPVFDVGTALDACLASLHEQRVAGIEVVLVDDASSDADARRLAAWRERWPEAVRVVTHASNRGVSAARNTLLDEARGDWLWFVDPDDVVEPGALVALAAIVETHAPDVVVCDFRTFDDAAAAASGGVPAAAVRRPHVRAFEGRSDVLSESREALVAGLFRSGQLHLWSKVVRRAAWPAGLRFPEGRVFEDLAVFPRVALAARTHFHAAQVWVSYRQRAGSALATLDESKLDDWTHALAGFAQDLRASGLRADADLLFEVSHFSARTLLRALRRLRRLPGGPDTPARRQLYLARWRESSPMDAATLARAYLSRRLFGRWAQWRMTMRRLAR